MGTGMRGFILDPARFPFSIQILMPAPAHGPIVDDCPAIGEGPAVESDPLGCEREPIHIPGAIQPHGAMLAAVADGLLVSHASANLAHIIGCGVQETLGKPLEMAIGAAACRELLEGLPGSSVTAEHHLRLNRPDGRAVALHAFRCGRHLCVDLEVAVDEVRIGLATVLVQNVLASFEFASSQIELCELAVAGLKKISGYDRVIAYRFGESGHGEVIAEARESHLDAYLGLRYPATDIPPQARALYLRQRVGAIADAAYEPVPLLADPTLDDGSPLDLTHSTLRSVSPVHREYMRNMNTAASLTVGLRHRGELWGMLVCHHATPRIAGPELRNAAGLIGQVVSLLIESLGEAEAQAHRKQRGTILRGLIDAFATGKPLPEALAQSESLVLRLVAGGGALLRFSGADVFLGRTPPAATARRALAMMLERAGGDVLAVDDLGQWEPDDCAKDGSGALLLPLMPGGGDAILWFRPELARTVTWAGNPALHGRAHAQTGQVSPRRSFEAWKETVRGRSSAWSEVDRTLAGELRSAIQAELARRTQLALEASQRHSVARLLAFIRQAPVSVAIFDRAMVYLAVSDRWLEEHGRVEADLIGRRQYEVYPDLPESWRQIHQRALAGEMIRNDGDLWVQADGERRWQRWAVVPWTDEAGAIGGIIISSENITAAKRDEERIVHLATHDSLTDLPNLVLMKDRVRQAIELARRKQCQFALLLLDLDHFKFVNDGYGHAFGDAVLKAAGLRIQSMLRAGDSVARLGGDEFLVLIADMNKRADAYVVAQKLLEGFRKPFAIQGREVFLTASIGVSVYPQDGSDGEQLMSNADIAMYRAKAYHRDTYQFFTAEMSVAAQTRVRLEGELRFALERGQLGLLYQPKVDLATGLIVGCEALVRWNHPELGAISPAQFIPIAEDTGLILSIGDWVLRTACAQAKAWLEAELPPIVMSINLSARQFRQEDIVSWLRDVLVDCDMDPEHVELELTESILAEDSDSVIEVVGTFKRMGLKLSIDDFGTGYSSLAYLKRFRVDTLKIDQSFIRNMLKEPGDMAIVRTIIGLAHNMGMTAIAEGVESVEQGEFLRDNGCDAIQGYLFSKPLAAQDMAEQLRSGRRLSLASSGGDSGAPEAG